MTRFHTSHLTLMKLSSLLLALPFLVIGCNGGGSTSDPQAAASTPPAASPAGSAPKSGVDNVLAQLHVPAYPGSVPDPKQAAVTIGDPFIDINFTTSDSLKKVSDYYVKELGSPAQDGGNCYMIGRPKETDGKHVVVTVFRKNDGCLIEVVAQDTGKG